MSGNPSIVFCSAAGAVVFLVPQTAILPRPHSRILFALAALLGALLIPALAPFDARILLLWIGTLLAGWMAALWLGRGEPSVRQWWTVSDLVGTSGFIASGLFSIGDLILGSGTTLLQLRPIGAFLAIAGAAHLIHELHQSNVLQRPAGLTFAQALAITGILALAFHGIDAIGVLCLVAGLAILALRLRSFLAGKEEHRILDRISVAGERLQPEYSAASVECPEPRLWSMYDSMTAEKEVLDLLYALVRAVKPKVTVETGAFSGISSTYIARALRDNGRGRLITCEVDPVVYETAKNRLQKENLESIVDCRLSSSFDLNVRETIDLLYCDSDLDARVKEVRKFIDRVNPFGLILMHDGSSQFRTVREGAAQLESEGLISVVFVSTPRGLVIAQKRQGRK